MKKRLPLLFLVASAACLPPIDTDVDGGGLGPINVGPDGGIFVRGGAVLDIPKGALSSNVSITLAIIDTGIPDIAGRARIGLGYRFSPASITFKLPVHLVIPYLETRVPEGVEAKTFDLRIQNAKETPVALAGSRKIDVAPAVEAQTEKLGTFWATSAATADVASLTLSPEDAFLRVGETQAYTSVAKNSEGTQLNLDAGYSVAPARVGMMDGGVLTALSPGMARVKVQVGARTASVWARVIGDTQGPTLFEHDNPFPTGNDLWGGTSLPLGLGTVFVGGNGTILVNAQGTWRRAASAVGLTLKGIGGTNENNIAAVGSTGFGGAVIELSGSASPKVTPFDGVEPRAFWYDGTYGMAVGVGNDVIVRRDAGWVKEYSPSIETLLHVVGDGTGAFVTVGSRGSIYRYDPNMKAWNSLYQTQLSTLLVAATLTDAQGQSAWAVGGNKLWRFAQGAWAATNLPDSPQLTEVTVLGAASDKLIVGGRTGKVGQAWVVDIGAIADGGLADGGFAPITFASSLRVPQVPRGYIPKTSTSGFLVGDVGAVYAYDTGVLTEVSRGFLGNVAGVARVSDDVFAAVNECVDVDCKTRSGVVMHRLDAGVWEPLGSPQPFSGPLVSMAAQSSTSVIAVASTGVFSWDGTGWKSVPLTSGITASRITQVARCGSAYAAVGKVGLVLRGGTGLLGLQPSPSTLDLHAVHCPTSEVVWVAGNTLVAERASANAPSWSVKQTEGVTQGNWRAVWSPGLNEGFAFGDARFGVLWTGEELASTDSLGGVYVDIINAAYGSKPDNLYLVGRLQLPAPIGIGLRFDGAYFRPFDTGAERNVVSIDGVGDTDIWLGTEAGGVLKATK